MKKITIDGFSLTGKTSASKLLWEQTHSVYLSTGKIWRAVGQYYLVKNLDSVESLINSLEEYIRLDEDSDGFGFFINEAGIVCCDLLNYTYSLNSFKKFSDKEVEETLLYLSQSKKLRKLINSGMKTYLNWLSSNYKFDYFILDGRDCGTNIFPEADLKVFLHGSIDERVKKLIKRTKEVLSLTEAKQHLFLRDRADEENILLTDKHLRIRTDFKEVYQVVNIIKEKLKEV